MLVQTWREAYLLWDAKDWSMEALAQEIKDQIASGKRPMLANLTVNGRRLSLSESSIQRLASTDERIPDVLAELVEELKAQNPGAEAKTQIVEEGLRVIRGRPSQRDVQELALALLAHLPTNDLALKLADALLTQAQTASGNGSLLDVFATAIAGRVPYIDPARLARILAKRLNRFRTKHVALAGGIGSAAACAVGLALFFALPSRSQAAPPGPLVFIVANVGVDGSPVRFEPGSLIAMSELGEKAPPEQLVPVKTLPGQKVAPCDEGIGQKTINGNCWFRSGDVKPPCGRLFRSGDGCYAPVAADPQKPVGSDASPAPAR